MNTMLKNLARLTTVVSALTVVGCGGGSSETSTNLAAVNPQEPVSDWQLVWADEFDGATINQNNWTHEVNCAGGGNQERQCYTDSEENSFVSDGMLNIVAKAAEEGAQQPYTSARLNTRYKADFTYGRIEMRAKMPEGQGSWPAFWMMPTDEVYGGWPRSGEIDIVEAVNLKVENEDSSLESNIFGTIHYGKDPENRVFTGAPYLPATNPADDFHTYTIEWEEGEIRWYFDDHLYATQRQSTVRTNAKGDVIGLEHRGWFVEIFDIVTGEKKVEYSAAPFDQDFYLILNLAVGGDFPENLNQGGVDPEAFAGEGQAFQIDYVRVFECAQDPLTGKGCATVRPGYDSLDDALLEGEAPIPSPPSTGIAQNLTIFDGTPNPNWAAWDCCGGSTPAVVEDSEKGQVYEFLVGATPTVNGFISRDEFITDEAGKATPFDASPILETGTVSFDLKVTSAPNDPASTWLFKIESVGASTAVELPLTESVEGVAPPLGEWQTYTFTLEQLSAAGLDVAAIDVIMIFPAWMTGDGAVYRVANAKIASDSLSAPSLTLFDDAANPDWVIWDCCGGTTPEVVEDDAEHGQVAEFAIGATPTVMGFNTRVDQGGTGKPFDASAILTDGVVEFEMRVVSAPTDPNSTWLFKIESNDAATAVELPLTESVEGVAPVVGEWQKYTFTLQQLSDAGLDISGIDVLMVFPAWMTGDGAVYRLDNAKIYSPSAASGGSQTISIFQDGAREGWVLWDCCGGTSPTTVEDATEGTVAEFSLGATPAVNGFITRSAEGGGDNPIDATALLNDGVLKFDVRVISAPTDPDSTWLFKIESTDAATAVELALTESVEGVAPVVGEWMTFSYPLQDLFNLGLDVSSIDVVMVFPAWMTGDGAVYRVDNFVITNGSGEATDGDTSAPAEDNTDGGTSGGTGGDTSGETDDSTSGDDTSGDDTSGDTSGGSSDSSDASSGGSVPADSVESLPIYIDNVRADWILWDCCGGSTPAQVEVAERGFVSQFTVVDGGATVQGYSTRSDVGGGDSAIDASAYVTDGSLSFDLNIATAGPNGTDGWLLKIESNGGAQFAEVGLETATEGYSPTVGSFQTFTFPLADLVAAGLDASAIDVILVFPTWMTGSGAVYQIDNVTINTGETIGGDVPTDSAGTFPIYTDNVRADWILWDCCGGSTPAQVEVAGRGWVSQYTVVDSGETVQGYTTRSDVGGGDSVIDASALAAAGNLSFDLNIVNPGPNGSEGWLLKIESNGGAQFAEVALETASEGYSPSVGSFQTFTFPLAYLVSEGLDASAIDVILVFPAWTTGGGAVYQLDNVQITQ